jgi:DUF1680 family protein
LYQIDYRKGGGFLTKLTPKQIVQTDAEGIYIGNLFTVESDLLLPTVGKNGAEITWTTNMPHIINSKGGVVQPREGAGNREVTLTANVSYGGETATREFLVTVLALKSDVKIVRALVLNESVLQNSSFELPNVVVVQKDDKTFTTAVVAWKNMLDIADLPVGVYEITGEALPETQIIPRAVIEVKSGTDKTKDIPAVLANKANYGDVSITGGYFNDNRLRGEEFLLSCNLDTMLYNFRQAAGLDLRGAEPMSGWDAPEGLLRGHTTGHYLSGIALAYAGKTENQDKFGEMITYMVEGLAECQDAMENSGKFNYGFLSGYDEDQFDKLEEFVVYPKIWAPYYTLHKIIAGLLDCYEYADSQKALDVAAKIGIWVYNRLCKLPKEQLQKMWAMYIAGEFGGINESLAKLKKFIDKPEFLVAAKLFDNDRLFYPMSKNIDTLGGIHGNQHVPQIIGALEIFARTGEKVYYDIARNFWHVVTDAHIYNIGGAGEGEMFQDSHKIGTKLSEKTAESCVSYNMLKLTSMLFEYEPKAAYIDYFEKTLYNHIAASQDQGGPVGGSTYFMPLLPGAKKGYDTRGNTCCHGTGLENHVKYQDGIYYLRDKTVFVNLYIPSALNIADGGRLEIVSDFLSAGDGHKAKVKIVREGFDELRLRIPCWSEGGICVKLNGTKLSFEEIDGYAIVKGFKVGDTLDIAFDFKLRVEATKDAPDVVALYYGPLVLVAIDESDKFITLDEGFEDRLQQIGDYEFALDGRKFVPNYYAWAEKYHAYFKVGGK